MTVDLEMIGLFVSLRTRKHEVVVVQCKLLGPLFGYLCIQEARRERRPTSRIPNN